MWKVSNLKMHMYQQQTDLLFGSLKKCCYGIVGIICTQCLLLHALCIEGAIFSERGYQRDTSTIWILQFIFKC